MSRKILTLPEVAERLNLRINTLRAWRAAGQGPKTFRLGGRVVAFEDDVDAWVLEQYNEPLRT